MKSTPLPPYQFIQSQAAWETCLDALRREPQLALDLESNSLYVYYERICLIQISTPNRDYIVDPFADLDLAGLGEIIADPAVEKIFHAAEYDMILMKREHGWELRNLFDTMWAARILGYQRIGLANMLEDLFGVQLDKKFQRANWGKRPLPPEQLAYAQKDTHYLFDLRDHLAREIEQAGRMTEAQETFALQTRVTLPENGFHPDDFWSINGVKELSARARAILKALNAYRHRVAEKQDLPPYRIMRNKTMLALAQRAPRTLDQLVQIKGISQRQVKYHGNSILKALHAGRHAPLPKRPPRPPKPPEDVLQRYDTLRQWRKERARRRGVESDVILSRDALWDIAKENPQTLDELATIADMGDWRHGTYGEEILNILQMNGKT